MRPLRRAASATVVALVAFTATPLLAQTVIQKSFATQLFEPAMGQDIYLSVEGPRVNDHLGFDVGMMFNYARNPLVLFKQSSAGSVTASDGFLDDAEQINVVENQMTADVVASIGFRFKWFKGQLGLGLPINLLLTGNEVNEQGNTVGELSGTGVGDLRIQLKAMLFEDLMGFSLAFSPIITAPTGSSDSFGGESNVSVRPRIVAGYRIGDFSIAANVGYLFRANKSLYFSSELTDQIIYGVGAGYKVHDRITVLAEVFGRASFNTASGCSFDTTAQQTVCDGTSNTDLDGVPLETDFGARVKVMHGLYATVGLGFGLIKAIGSPQVRVLAGAVWAPDFQDSDGDGVYDYEDKCPTQKEDADGFEDGDGCPELDNDGDLIPDSKDKCPNEKEDKDTFEDEDGCPDVDNDKDGIPDLQDACPFKPETKNGFSDEDGCPDVPDHDGDQVEDSKDKCPKQQEDIDGFEDEDGCPDYDNDNDEVPDSLDACPNDAEDMDGFQDDDGCPDLDNDNDGVPDKQDKCPKKPETINGYRDTDGCPDRGNPQVIIKENKIVITKRVYFATARAKIKARSFSILDQVALVLKANPQIKGVRIEGHTDSRGKAEKNKRLSQKRAEAVRDFLITKGVEAGRLMAVGYGSEKPIADNRSRYGRAKNRRVEFVILDSGSSKEGEQAAPADTEDPPPTE